MRTKIVAALVAGGLLVGAGLLTSAISAPGTARAQDETDEKEDRGPVSHVVGFLGDVLDELVEDGTITEDQADAIVEATENKVEEVIEEHHELRGQLSDFLEDGVITEAEAAELPDDHWLLSDVFDEAWQDGELSFADIRELRPFRGGGHDLSRPDFLRNDLLRQGLRFGALLDEGGIDQEEYDSLNDDHPLKQIDVSEYLSDGVISLDEFREIFSDLRDSFDKDA